MAQLYSTPLEIDGRNVEQYKNELKKLIAREVKRSSKYGKKEHYFSFLSSEIEKEKVIFALNAGKSMKAKTNSYIPSKNNGIQKTKFANYVRLFNTHFKDVEFKSDEELYSCFEICVAICEVDSQKEDREKQKTWKKEYNRKYGLFRFDNIVKIVPFVLAIPIVLYLNSCDDEREKKRKFCEKVNPNLNLSTSLGDSAQCDILYEQHLKYQNRKKN